MTPDLMEERLRSALHDATSAQDGAYLDLDPSFVLGRGRRAVRRRRVAAGASVAAATVVVGLVGWSALGGGAERATAPGDSSSSMTAPWGVELTRPSLVDQENGVAVEGQKVRVTVDLRSRSVRYTDPRTGTPLVSGTFPLPESGDGATWAAGSEESGVVVGLVPDRATDFTYAWSGDEPGSARTTAPLPGTGYQAFAVWMDAPGLFRGLDWTDGDAVYRSDGSRTTSRVDGDLVAFVDEKEGLFGLFGDGTTATKRLRDTAAGERPVMMLGNQLDGADTLTNAVLVILPAGADDVVATATPGATVTATSTLVDRAIEPTLVVVRLVVPTAVAGTGLGSIRWTEADGRTSTFEPRI